MYSLEFQQFWAVYPRNVGKVLAYKKYNQALKKVDHGTIINATIAYAKHTENTDKQYICHASTWLGQERWNDDLGTETRSINTPSGSINNRTSATRSGMAAASKVAQKSFQKLQQGDKDDDNPLWL